MRNNADYSCVVFFLSILLLIMEKLVDLLNKYEKEKIINEGGSVDEDDNYFGRSIENGKIVNRNHDPDAHSFMNEYIISKKFEFIKWLVSEGHINEGKFFTMTEQIQDAGRKIDPPEFETKVNDLETYNKIRKKYLSERLIMFLSIQDDPIKVLISIIE